MVNFNNIEFGNKLKSARIKKELSLEYVGKKIGKNLTGIYNSWIKKSKYIDISTHYFIFFLLLILLFFLTFLLFKNSSKLSSSSNNNILFLSPVIS